MFETELIANNTSLDLKEDVPISLNFSIADIRQPEKRNGSYSKTIKIYGTKTNNKFFEHYYAVNTVTSSFTPNLNTPCYLIQNGCVVFEGNLRLLSVEVILQNDIEEVTYEVAIFGDNNTLFAEIGDSKLTDLDLSAYNHTYNRVNQYNSWSATQGTGYVYPLLDYGYNGFNANSFAVEHFRPAFYLKQYIDSIFAAAGKTYTSTFFNTAFFKSLIIPHNGDKFTMSAANQALNEFYVGDDGLTAPSNFALTYVSFGSVGWMNAGLGTSPSTRFVCKFNDETTSPFTDPNMLYDNTTGIFTVNSDGQYNISGKIAHEVLFNHSSVFTSVQVGGGAFFTGKIWKRASPASPWVQLLTGTLSYATGTWGVGSSIVTSNYNNANVVLLAGEQLCVTFDILVSGGFGAKYYNGVTELTTGTASFDINLSNTATLKFQLSSANYLSGQSLLANDAIPKDIKQKDLLLSVIKMFNLYVDIDASNPNNYIVEPRNDFYNTGSTKDWSQKLAYDKPFMIKPMAEIDAKKFIYKYKDDTDYYNKTYFDSYAESYGTHTLDVVNDFTKNDNKTELIFSPTPVSDNANNSLIIPQVFAYDGAVVKPQKFNLRILMYNGVVTNGTPSWAYVAPAADALGAASLAMTTYPQAAMVDNPLAPTVSIEFGVPNEVFYNLGTNYTTNNLYNKYYYKMMSEITDRDSKLVTAYFKLDPIDIATFSFKDVIWIRDSYYYVNKIIDYNPLTQDLTKVELLKLKNYDDYVAATPTVAAIETNTGNTGITARMFGGITSNVGISNSVVVGDNNASRSSGSIISGTGNTIESDSYKVTIVSSDFSEVGLGASGVTLANCSGVIVGNDCYAVTMSGCYGCTVADGVYNFVGINLHSETITAADSGTTRLGGNVVNFNVTTARKTADFVIDPDVNYYEIDCTAGNITASYVLAAYNYENRIIYFNRVDSSANSFILDEASGTTTIIGNVFPYNTGMVQWDDLPVMLKGIIFRVL